MATILVTGGAGYIGSHTCKALARAGHRPVVLDNLSRGHARAVQWGPLVRGDLADPASLDRAMKEHAPDSVIHFAAYAYVGESVEDPAGYYANNLTGTLNLLEAMRRSGCTSIVFSSSCSIYGNPVRLPLAEDHPFDPLSPYARSKLMIEQILGDYVRAYGFSAVALRYFNAAGADPDGALGEDHDPETHLIPLVLRAARDGEAVSVFGQDYPTPDGTCIRDYVHVYDLARAHVLALEELEPQSSLAVNLGTGEGHSVLGVIKAARKVTGLPVSVRNAPRRPGDAPELVADPALSRELLGWTPDHPDLEPSFPTPGGGCAMADASMTSNLAPRRFHVVIPCRNAAEYIGPCLDSLTSQSFKDWRALVADDASDDRMAEAVAPHLKDPRISYRRLDSRAWLMGNTLDALRSLNLAPSDVVAILDGDDFLYPGCLQRLWEAHLLGYDLVYTDEVIEGQDHSVGADLIAEVPVRRQTWRFSQLRSFKAYLFSLLPDETFRDSSGRYFRAAGDLALYLPMAELAGPEKIRWIPEKLYHYRVHEECNFKVLRQEQLDNNWEIRNRPPLDRQTTYFDFTETVPELDKSDLGGLARRMRGKHPAPFTVSVDHPIPASEQGSWRAYHGLWIGPGAYLSESLLEKT